MSGNPTYQDLTTGCFQVARQWVFELNFMTFSSMAPMPTWRVGTAFLSVGIVLYGTWALWIATRTERPVNIPISMAVGHLRTPEFKLNLNAPYTIEIEVQKTIPFDALNCLLGMALTSTELKECRDRPSVVNASWILTSGGKAVARGSSNDYRSGSWMNDSIARELGHFQSESGRRYVLEVDVLADGSALASGNPRLKVEAYPGYYETTMYQNLFILLATGALVLVGVVLLAISLIRKRRTRVQTANS
jgi:hypothetical protein